MYFFFFNDTATTEIYTLSLHDALPIYHGPAVAAEDLPVVPEMRLLVVDRDRKSTRLNSSHVRISYAVFCLKKKKVQQDRDDARGCPGFVPDRPQRRGRGPGVRKRLPPR